MAEDPRIVTSFLGSAALAASQKRAAETGEVDGIQADHWLGKHWPAPRTCPVCRHDEWGLTPKFVRLPLGPVGEGPVGTYQPVRTLPCVAVVCRTCGNT